MALQLRDGGVGPDVSGGALEVRQHRGGQQSRGDTHRGPPLRVTNPERFAAFMAQCAAFNERKLEEEDARERARAAQTGERYRTRAERAAAAAEEQQQRRPDGDKASGEAGGVTCRFDAAEDYYLTIGVSSTASRKEIRRAYKRCALKWHPDKQSPDAAVEVLEAAEAAFKLLSRAAQILLDPVTRAAYDLARGGNSKSASGSGAASAAAPRSHAASKSRVQRIRIDLPLPLHSYMTGGCFAVAVPGDAGTSEDVRVDVQLGARAGDEIEVKGIVITLRDVPDPAFKRIGLKDLLCASPPLALPRAGDLFWAQTVCGPCSDASRSGFVCVSLLQPWLAGDATLPVIVPRLGLPDPKAPHFEPPGNLIVHLPLHPSGEQKTRRLLLAPQFSRLGAIVLAGSSAPTEKIASAVSALPLRSQGLKQRCVCIVLGGAGGHDASADEQRVRDSAAVACPGACCTLITAPLHMAHNSLAMLQDDWACLCALDPRLAPDVVIVALARQLVDFSDTNADPPHRLPSWPTLPPHRSATQRLPGRVRFAVVHGSAVAVRAYPSLEGDVIGRRAPAACVIADARFKDWIRVVADNDDPTLSTSPSGEAWMLTQHPHLGQLLMSLPQPDNSAAPTLHRVLPRGGVPTHMRVCHEPVVAVRASPLLDGHIISSRRANDVVSVLGVHHGWARVVVPHPPRGFPPFGWMMVAHQTLGQLLAPLQGDSADSDSSSEDDVDDHDWVAVSGLSQPSSACSSCADLTLVDKPCPGPDDVARAAADCGLLSALQALRCTGTHIVLYGGGALHLCGVPPGGAPTEGLMKQSIVRESDEQHLWHSLSDATASWIVHVTGLGLSRTNVVTLTDAWQGDAPACNTKQMLDAAAAAAAASEAISRRRSVLDALARAGVEQTSAGEDASIDVFGRLRAGCAASGCSGYARPIIPNAGPNAKLLLVCAVCGGEATEHEEVAM